MILTMKGMDTSTSTPPIDAIPIGTYVECMACHHIFHDLRSFVMMVNLTIRMIEYHMIVYSTRP